MFSGRSQAFTFHRKWQENNELAINKYVSLLPSGSVTVKYQFLKLRLNSRAILLIRFDVAPKYHVQMPSNGFGHSQPG